MDDEDYGGSGGGRYYENGSGGGGGGRRRYRYDDQEGSGDNYPFYTGTRVTRKSRSLASGPSRSSDSNNTSSKFGQNDKYRHGNFCRF